MSVPETRRVGEFASSGTVGAMTYAAVGGALAGGALLLVLASAAILQELPAITAPNAVGAWAVRWLQTAAPDALGELHHDATYGGIALALGIGLLVGAVFGGVMARLPDDHPAAWGLLLGALGWAGTRFALAPALDPVLLRVFDWRALLPAYLLMGVLLGMWVQVGRSVQRDPVANGA